MGQMLFSLKYMSLKICNRAISSKNKEFSEEIAVIQIFKYRLVAWRTQNKKITYKRTAQSAEAL